MGMFMRTFYYNYFQTKFLYRDLHREPPYGDAVHVTGRLPRYLQSVVRFPGENAPKATRLRSTMH